MIVHGAQRVSAARAWARIHAFVAYTRAIVRAIGVGDALGTTAYVGITLVLGQAGANATVAPCVRPAGTRIARIGKRGCRYKRMYIFRSEHPRK